VTARGLVDALLSALLAPPCASCGGVLDHPLDGAVCHTCWTRIAFLTPPVCDGCGDPLPSWRAASCAAGVCARCRRVRPAVDRMRAIGPYQHELRAIVHALKYGGRRSIAPRLGALMRHHGREILAGADAVVPVPLHPRRHRHRGFNQAALLARALNVPVLDALCRVAHTRPQVDLPAAQRHRNVHDAFQVVGTDRMGGSKDPPLRERGKAWGALARLRPSSAGAGLPPSREALRRTAVALAEAGQTRPIAVEGRILVLIDDVITTGATLNACARVLKAAGAREVRALTAARVVSAPPPAPDR
jgi:predicted amidophosphoribosyltransferase